MAVHPATLAFNNSGQRGRVVTVNGSVGVKGRTGEYGIYDNQNDKLTNITFVGANSFMLDAASTKTSASQNYVFDKTSNPSNYVGLILKNRSTYQGGTARIGANGWMELSGTDVTVTNTLSEVCTNWGKATLLSGTAKFTKSLRNYGLFEGTGRVTGGITNYSGSTVAPGGTNGYGTLTFAGKNALRSGSRLVCRFGGTGAGQYDALAIESGATLDLSGSTLECQLGFDPGAGQTWTLADNNGGTRVGTFSSATIDTMYQNKLYRFTVTYGAGTDDVTVQCVWLPRGSIVTIR
jgi:hypothetical protein